MKFPDGARVEAQVLWGSIGWATPAAFGAALADQSRRTILITGEGSHQLTANEIGSMGQFGAKVIVFVLNNGGYLIERALEENPDWTYNNLRGLEVRRPAADARMRRLVLGAGRNAGRTGRGDEGGARQQIGRLHRDHRRENGHAARPRLRARPSATIVRQRAVERSADRPATTTPPCVGRAASFFQAVRLNLRLLMVGPRLTQE